MESVDGVIVFSTTCSDPPRPYVQNNSIKLEMSSTDGFVLFGAIAKKLVNDNSQKTIKLCYFVVLMLSCRIIGAEMETYVDV